MTVLDLQGMTLLDTGEQKFAPIEASRRHNGQIPVSTLSLLICMQAPAAR